MWRGAAAICVNSEKKVLMVLQGKPNEHKKWSVPSGEKWPSETYEQCCVREVKEETGYDVKVIRKIYEKTGVTYGIEVYVCYFEVIITGGQAEIKDPDHLIHDIAWISLAEIDHLDLAFPEDRSLIEQFCTRIHSVSRNNG